MGTFAVWSRTSMAQELHSLRSGITLLCLPHGYDGAFSKALGLRQITLQQGLQLKVDVGAVLTIEGERVDDHLTLVTVFGPCPSPQRVRRAPGSRRFIRVGSSVRRGRPTLRASDGFVSCALKYGISDARKTRIGSLLPLRD